MRIVKRNPLDGSRAALAVALFLGGCGETATTSAPTAAAPAAPAASKQAAPAAAAEAAALSELSDEAFAESSQNRDPFRSYLDLVANPTFVPIDVHVLMSEFSLEELKLVATISGGAAPRAMFQGPHGMGVIVQRGDHISRASARVARILPGKVIVEIRKQRPGQKPEVSLREIEASPGAEVQ